MRQWEKLYSSHCCGGDGYKTPIKIILSVWNVLFSFEIQVPIGSCTRDIERKSLDSAYNSLTENPFFRLFMSFFFAEEIVCVIVCYNTLFCSYFAFLCGYTKDSLWWIPLMKYTQLLRFNSQLFFLMCSKYKCCVAHCLVWFVSVHHRLHLSLFSPCLFNAWRDCSYCLYEISYFNLHMFFLCGTIPISLEIRKRIHIFFPCITAHSQWITAYEKWNIIM